MDNLKLNSNDLADLMTRLLLHVEPENLAQMALLSPRPSPASRACMVALHEIDPAFALAVEETFPFVEDRHFNVQSANVAVTQLVIAESQGVAEERTANLPGPFDEVSIPGDDPGDSNTA